MSFRNLRSQTLKNFIQKRGRSISVSDLRQDRNMGKLSGKVAIVTASTEG